MAVKTPVLYNGMYISRNMGEQQAEMILQTRNESNIENLKNMLFDFPLDMVLESLESGESIRNIIKMDNIDYTKYITTLRDYQTVGTAFMYISPRSILADGCGLGKTAEVAGLINFLKMKNDIGRFLIAVENSAVNQTQVELMRFTGLYVVQMPSETAKLKKFVERTDWSKVDGMVIKHSCLRNDYFSKWIALNMREDGRCKLFDTFFLDESSVIKNSGTKIFEYTKNICNICFFLLYFIYYINQIF